MRAEDPFFSDVIFDLLRQSIDYVAIEDFSIQGNTQVFRGNRLIVVQVIGQVKEIARRLEVPIVMVRPVDRKWWNPSKLGMIGLSKRYGNDHARDAVYIALYAGYHSKSGPRRNFGSDAIRHVGKKSQGTVRA
jgi:hypothetical protein